MVEIDLSIVCFSLTIQKSKLGSTVSIVERNIMCSFDGDIFDERYSTRHGESMPYVTYTNLWLIRSFYL